MIYLPDTNVCIAYLRKKNANVIQKFRLMMFSGCKASSMPSPSRP